MSTDGGSEASSDSDDGRNGVRGVVAAAVLCFCLAAATALRLPVFFGADERPHFAYAAAVVHGDLPRLDDRVPTDDDRFPILERWADGLAATDGEARETIFVANHPPLFYVLAAGPMWLASLTGSDVLPPLTLRLLNAGFMSLGVLLTGLLARDVFARARRRDLLAVLAAGVVAVTPNLVGVAALGHNDGLGFALAAAALVVAVRLLRRGPDRGLVVGAAVVAGACGLTRASLLPAVLLMAGAAVIGAWRHRPPDRRWVPGLGAASAIAAAPVVTAGWFYLRNRDLYGSLTGDRHNLALLGRVVEEHSIVDVLTSGRFHHDLWTGLFGSVHPHLALGIRGLVVLALATFAVAGLVVRRRRHRRGVREAGDRAALAGSALAPWALLGAYALVVMIGVADHVAQGGAAHPRYLLPLVPLVAVVLAAAVDVLPRRKMVGRAVTADSDMVGRAVTADSDMVGRAVTADSSGWVAVGIVAPLAAVTVRLMARYGDLVAARERDGEVALPGPAAWPVLSWLAWGLAGAAFVLVLRALWTSGPPSSPPSPSPRDPETGEVVPGSVAAGQPVSASAAGPGPV
jgi:4-amino-4-deoxy-L-arabinose transferase-like glycosyltransferase